MTGVASSAGVHLSSAAGGAGAQAAAPDAARPPRGWRGRPATPVGGRTGHGPAPWSGSVVWGFH